jgi:hypothetical protein
MRTFWRPYVGSALVCQAKPRQTTWPASECPAGHTYVYRPVYQPQRGSRLDPGRNLFGGFASRFASDSYWMDVKSVFVACRTSRQPWRCLPCVVSRTKPEGYVPGSSSTEPLQGGDSSWAL